MIKELKKLKNVELMNSTIIDTIYIKNNKIYSKIFIMNDFRLLSNIYKSIKEEAIKNKIFIYEYDNFFAKLVITDKKYYLNNDENFRILSKKIKSRIRRKKLNELINVKNKNI